MARKQTNVRLTPRARDGFDRAARRASVDLTAFVEAVGLALSDGSLELPPEVIEQAQQIMYDRNNP